MSIGRTFELPSIAFALSLGLAACGGGGGDTEEGGGDGTSGGEVPEQYAGPIGSEDAAAGATIFEQACNACHAGDAPQLADLGWTAPRVRQQVREGGEGMPPIPETRLSAEDLEKVLAHMVTIGAVSTGG